MDEHHTANSESSGFLPVFLAANELVGASFPWLVGGGWAIDLFLGRVTRPHSDVDVLILRRDQFAAQQHLLARGWIFEKVVMPNREPWLVGERLELPVHEIHGHRPGTEPNHYELLLNEGDQDTWRFRRNPEVSCAWSVFILHTDDGIPFLAPEVALLYKGTDSKDLVVPKNRTDFESVLPVLDEQRRDWLRDVLKRHWSGHPWLEEL